MNWYLDAGDWTLGMKLLFIIPTIIIAAVYVWIPLNGFIFWKSHREGFGNHKNLLLWYAGMLFCSGTNRILMAFSFYFPVYELRMAALILTALFAVKAGFGTRAFLKDAIKLPSREELHDAVDKFAAEKAIGELATIEKDILIKEQRASIARLVEIIETQVWINDKDLALKELSSMLERMNSR